MSDLQLQFYIASAQNGVVSSSATPNWKLASLTLTCSFIQLDTSAQAVIDEAQGGTYKWSGELWKTYNFNLNSGSAGDNVIVPFKGSSLKTVVALMRPANHVGTATALTNTNRYNAYQISSSTSSSSWFATVGNITFPNIPLKNSAMMMAESLKAWHSLNTPQGLTTQFDINNWEATPISATTTTSTTAGSFAAAVNLEAYTNKTGTIHSGQSVIGGTTLVLNQVYASTLPVNMLQTTLCHYDAICTVENGLLSVAF